MKISVKPSNVKPGPLIAGLFHHIPTGTIVITYNGRDAFVLKAGEKLTHFQDPRFLTGNWNMAKRDNYEPFYGTVTVENPPP